MKLLMKYIGPKFQVVVFRKVEGSDLDSRNLRECRSEYLLYYLLHFLIVRLLSYLMNQMIYRGNSSKSNEYRLQINRDNEFWKKVASWRRYVKHYDSSL